MTRKKKIQSSVGGKLAVFCCGGKFSLRPEKKDTLRLEKKRYSCLSDGCAVLAIPTGKKRYSRLSGRLCCCIVSVFGSGGKLAVFLLWRENFITTEKKDTVVCLAGARSLLRPEKKIQSSTFNLY
jgi:hypothetical protein